MASRKKTGTARAFLMAVTKLLHFCVSVSGFLAVWWLFYSKTCTADYGFNVDVLSVLLYSVLLFFLFRSYDVYNIGYARTLDNVFGQVLSDLISAGAVYLAGSILFGGLLNPLYLLALCAVQAIWNFAWSKAAKALYYKIYKQRCAVVVYRNKADLARIEEIRHLERKFVIEKLIENPDNDYKQLERELEGYEAILVAGVDATLRNGIAKYCIENNVRGYFAPHVGDIIMQGATHLRSFHVPIFSVRRAFKPPFYLLVKRLFDFFVSLIALVLISPIYLIISLVIKLSDGGPVLYKQKRLTKDGKVFNILKFRSMSVDAEKDGVARLASENDDRITPIGKIIRAVRLDELPQLINILCGDMSIVGPRPERPEIAEQYEKEMPAFSLRLQVKAGLTGFAQVYGKYNSTPYDKLQMDLMYVNKMSITEDLRLMFATLRILFIPESTEGIADGQTTAMGYNNPTDATEKRC